VGAEGVLCVFGVEEGIDEAQPVIEDVGQADRGQRVVAVAVAVLDHARLDGRFLDHGGELEDVHVGHSAIRVPRVEVAAEERVLLLRRPGRTGGAHEARVALEDSLLAAAGPEVGDPYPRRETGRAFGAGRPVEHVLRPPEALLGERVVQLLRLLALQRREQLPLAPPRQVGAALRGRHVELWRYRKRMAHDGVVRWARRGVVLAREPASARPRPATRFFSAGYRGRLMAAVPRMWSCRPWWRREAAMRPIETSWRITDADSAR
jgi:hypothetical protein